MSDATALVGGGDVMEATKLIQEAIGDRLKGHVVKPDIGQRLKALKSLAPRLGELTATRVFRRDERREVTDPVAREKVVPRTVPQRGAFIESLYTAGTSRARYKLYIPSTPVLPGAPLVVLLHGCTQDPDDFAAGTEMNSRAEKQGFFVLYPEQSASANPSRCWNWFKPEDQQRDRGEPALIVGMTRQVLDTYAIDPGRVYVAGLSAGGAMAAIVSSLYPELYAAVGVHSGLPAGAAGNLPDALSAMRRGVRPGRRKPAAADRPVPTIVFTGGRDTTVHPANSQAIIDETLAATPVASAPIVEGVSPGGKRYTRAQHMAESGAVVAEHWIVHDSPHAWSGGNAKGSHTDADGPSATDEMLRFFNGHVQP